MATAPPDHLSIVRRDPRSALADSWLIVFIVKLHLRATQRGTQMMQAGSMRKGSSREWNEAHLMVTVP
jgi:hypothetical protein